MEESTNDNIKDSECKLIPIGSPLHKRESLKNEYIDNLSLELLINKNHYKKYLSKKDPEKYKEYQEYQSKLIFYMDEITEITTDLLNDPKKGISRDITETFEQYTKMCIRYLEMKEIENSNENHTGFSSSKEEEQEDILFANIDSHVPEPSKSYWGEPIIKKANINAFSMDMFLNKDKYK